MNSDQLTPNNLSSADTAPPEETGAPTARRSRSRRSAKATSDAAAANPGPELTTDVTSDTSVPDVAPTPVPSRRRRRGSAAAQETAPTPDDTLFAGAMAPRATGGASDFPTTPDIIQSLNAQGALVSEGSPSDAAAADAPVPRGRRRRGRGGRAAEPAGLVEVDLPLEAEAPPLSLDPVEPTLLLAGQTLDAADSDQPFDGDDGDEGAPAEGGAAESGSATGRRRRRRGRGGRGSGIDLADTIDAGDAEDIAASDIAEPLPLAVAEPDELEEPAASTSPAVRRRFDHMNWRERLGLDTAASQPAPAPVDAVAPPRLAAAPVPSAPGSSTPPAFERAGRGSRFGDRDRDRQPYQRASESFAARAQIQEPALTPAREPVMPESAPPTPFAPAASVASVASAPTRFAPAASAPTRFAPAASAAPSSSIITPAPAAAMPAVSPIVTPAAAGITPFPATPAAGAGTTGGADTRLVERLELLLQTQSAALQQQGQAIQALTATMAALQGAIERMSTTGIAAGMPRAGMFVDAPNIIYASENARVNIDYGRMLDFLGRGREMVHAIVYAPVTEDNGYRFDQQRFVAPFINKGYKMVTKPLKRFPDGTAKGNFDIELAIDIVTMSQRLDVVILISGDSDFSRLVELIQSRGVRVEVVSFASNVSWELVQMADVFIDVGQYTNEFRAM